MAKAAAPTVAVSNRWAIATCAVIVMILAGTVYAWSNFTQPLIAAFGWSSTQTSLVFGITIFAFSAGCVAGGRRQDRIGPRKVAVTGMLLWGIGNVLAAAGPHDVLWWDLTYGLLGGFGNGMAYIAPVATLTKWFPERRGLAGGLVVMGFGLGAFFYGFMLKAIPAYVTAAGNAGAYADAKKAAAIAGLPFDAPAHALGSADLRTIATIFVASGLTYAIVGCGAALMLRNPPAGYTAGIPLGAPAGNGASLTPAEMLRRPQFYVLWLLYFINVVAGIMVVSNAVPIIRELISYGITNPDVLRTLSGTAVSAYAFVAVFNALGRVLWGALSDRIGRTVALTCIYAIQAATFFALPGFHSVPLVLFAFAIILAAYGGAIGPMPAFTADHFGTRFHGQNYGYVLTASGIGALVGPSIAGVVKDATGSYTGAIAPMAIMLLFAIALPQAARRPYLAGS